MIHTRIYFMLLLFLAMTPHAIAWLQLPTWVTSIYHSQWSPSSTDLIEDCSDASYAVEIKDITLTPSFPEPGKELLIEAEGIIKEPIEDGAYVEVTVKLGVITLIRKTFDLCEEMQKNDVLDCPVKKGPLTLAKKVQLPKEIPRGDFRVFAQAYNSDESDLACLKAHVDFRKHRFGRFTY
ncbi:hypothetical protein O0I10_008844 [Lichtheimia ornata]|uniref:Phosphatidylglycerol/phosphatidylinositol transfer protein n=1 Tax=Lichtheimia ornata TaxID=688661 RepID=A0AAD7UYT8_9FUNG|nr:uncharacterized protein O0I10_008844 [Lichtheimia ornata]KAJ8655558.1 hypothetical protein O0I10_008844 [Lichtheimia ornata]